MVKTTRLNNKNLSLLQEAIELPGYDRSKIKSVAAVAMSMNRDARIKHSAIASTESAVTKQLILDFISLTPFQSHRARCLEVNSRSQLYRKGLRKKMQLLFVIKDGTLLDKNYEH